MNGSSIFFRATFRSNRLDYILDELLGRRLGLKYKLVLNDEPLPQGSVCLHYGISGGSIDFSDSGILKNEAQNFFLFTPGFEQYSLFNGKTEIQNDLFGAAFYLLSRYQEQNQPIQPDANGRFPDELHFNEIEFRETPLIEYWVESLRQKLNSLGLTCKKTVASPQFSLDWDNPTAYLNKGLWRQTAAMAGDFASGNWSKLRERYQVLSGQNPDPYDNLGTRIPMELLKGRHIFFWLGNYGKHDKGLSFKNQWYRNQIRNLSKEMKPGLHPSYASFSKPELILEEKKRLEEILDKEIIASRFHFLRFRIPQSYRTLEEVGITEDYSMGFSGFPGFRAGTAHPFKWFDLENNRISGLTIHPFSLMDSSAAFRGNSSKAFLESAKAQLKKGQELGFPVHAIFHNEHPNWAGWENAIQQFAGL